MVKLFQLQLEHYEKVEGSALSLEGKANQLAQMVRSNLGMAMQGFVVVPLFAGYDLRRRTGRIYTYDPTGGRYEETDFHADGSGGRDARTTIKLAWYEGMDRASAIELSVQALYEAADRIRPLAAPMPSGASTRPWPRSLARATTRCPKRRWPSASRPSSRPGRAGGSGHEHALLRRP
jgi:proteasome beta subunit